MNTERLLQLADVLELESTAEHFDLENFFSCESDPWSDFHSGYRPIGEMINECGTTACIAGWAVAIFEPEARSTNSFISNRARNLLDLTREQQAALFIRGLYYVNAKGEYPTPRECAKVIRNLVQTGEVEWEILEGRTYVYD